MTLEYLKVIFYIEKQFNVVTTKALHRGVINTVEVPRYIHIYRVQNSTVNMTPLRNRDLYICGVQI